MLTVLVTVTVFIGGIVVRRYEKMSTDDVITSVFGGTGGGGITGHTEARETKINVKGYGGCR